MENIISVKDISMRFHLASERVDNLKEFIVKKMHFNHMAYDDFWALHDISFSVKNGESIALIGSNGSGKSTMLKIISGILKPTKGTVEVSGTIAPLIELGAGFDPDLTGRENIYLNGAILGHTKRFMQEKYDEIVDFSGLHDFIDVPVKNYSSGMIARLGFSVATIVNPEILIVDEILAVGDKAFQDKCHRRMEQLMTGGTTVVLVSHSMVDVKRICQRAIWIEQGYLRFNGDVETALQLYNRQGATPAGTEETPHQKPDIQVTKAFLPDMQEYINEISDLWKSHWLTNMGVKHQTLQEQLEDYLDVERVDLLTNGHMALELSMNALGLQGEVITTPFTFASTTHAILRNGLQPVFCDIDPTNFTIDTDKLEDLITEKTCAIVPVHVYGNVCQVEKIERIAKKYNLKVIYDAAHAFGVRYKGKGIASYGDVSCFSFHATKVYHTIEGGAVCFKNDEGGQAFGLNIYRLKNFGIRGPETVDAVGANAKMNEFCASMGICNLRHVDEEIAKRKKVTAVYRRFLENVPGIQLNSLQADVVSNNSYFPIIFDKQIFGADRNMVAERLAADHIYARKYFYPLTTAFDAFQGQYDPRKTPVALRISENVLTLPLYAELPLTEAERIARLVLECRKGF